jgi:hypothetical protein
VVEPEETSIPEREEVVEVEVFDNPKTRFLLMELAPTVAPE